jgi:hypothetical protein
MMLREVLRLIETAGGPLTVTELSRRLGIDPGALEGMLEFWAHKGRLVVDGGTAAACSGSCMAGASGCGGCSGAAGCPFMARLPRSYSVVQPAVTSIPIPVSSD